MSLPSETERCGAVDAKLKNVDLPGDWSGESRFSNLSARILARISSFFLLLSSSRSTRLPTRMPTNTSAPKIETKTVPSGPTLGGAYRLVENGTSKASVLLVKLRKNMPSEVTVLGEGSEHRQAVCSALKEVVVQEGPLVPMARTTSEPVTTPHEGWVYHSGQETVMVVSFPKQEYVITWYVGGGHSKECTEKSSNWQVNVKLVGVTSAGNVRG